MVATGEHTDDEEDEDEGALRRVRASHVTRENLRRAIVKVINETLAVRDPQWWGKATSTASDSKRFGSWDSNTLTQFHARYGSNGIMIYWHVEKGRVCICSQVKSCSSFLVRYRPHRGSRWDPHRHRSRTRPDLAPHRTIIR